MNNDIITYHHSTTIQLLYQLSYRSIFNCEWIARIELAPFVWKTNILTVIRYPQVSERSACFLPLYIIIKEPIDYIIDSQVDHKGVEPLPLRS